ncbi:ribosomal L1 domain-containing protein 1-like [Tripterygium wilfordii]|uniref:Ribosomal L1 domain-containing protein 1-like n=1 Tax=Tripterygium wilfordii TaxID=458696 RepID=A0A7J7CBT3_TRIWF|nr:ribosomal L1 domain-containing protein 1-like [Tripterygium wilfordii]KAF5731327.1 ribosomal L1 domain-containing protein 1-like [Tripterygium wilfordii]
MAATNPPTAPPSSSSKVVEKAVNALIKWRDSKLKTLKPQLLEHDEFVFLILTLKKIPQKGRINAHKIPLPHPLTEPITSELCLIIDDRSKSYLTKESAQNKIKGQNIPISKVLKLSKLKTDYRPFEAKRKLCDSYDMFFADKRVIPLLPRLLGRQFFKKKKIPVPMDLKHQNWKEQIEKSCASAMLYLSTGTCSVVKVARLSMGKEEIVENLVAAINGIAETVPKKWGNVRSFHVKLLESLALPIYQGAPGIDDIKLKIQGVKDQDVDFKEEEGGEAVKDEEVEMKKKKKGRIHEVRNMDRNVGGIFDEDEMGGFEGEDGMNDTNGEMGGSELVGMTRKMADEGKAEDDKVARKAAKVKKVGLPINGTSEDSIKQKKQKNGGFSLKTEEVKDKEKKKKMLNAL